MKANLIILASVGLMFASEALAQQWLVRFAVQLLSNREGFRVFGGTRARCISIG